MDSNTTQLAQSTPQQQQQHQQNPPQQSQPQLVQAPQQTQQQPPQQPQQQPQQIQLTPIMQQPPLSQTQTSTSPACSVAATPTVMTQLPQGPRAEYLLVLPPGVRQPGVQSLRYPMTMSINQPNILQANSALLRSINTPQLIRTQTSTSGVMQTQTSQAQTSTMANIQGSHVQIPFSAAGPRGITLANGQILPLRGHQMIGPRATILQQPTLIRGVTQQMGLHPVIPTSQPMGLRVQGPISTGPIIHQTNVMNSNATAPSQMTPDDALAKGKSFFSSLLTRMNIKSKKTIQNLIQDLIDGKKTSEEFASALQKELNSGPQVQLVPFLELLLPILRQSIIEGKTELPGIRPPSSSQDSSLSQQSNDSNPSISSPSKVQLNNLNASAAKKKKVPLAPGQKSAYAIKKEAREAKRKEKEILASSQGIKLERTDDRVDTPDKDKAKPKPDKSKRQDKQKKQDKQLESLSSALRDDDDVNDVAAMGGVNLAEESQRIMASGAELVGTQIRSCKDEPFFDTEALSARIAKIAEKYNLSEPSKEVVTIISHATQQRLKDMVERLGCLAEHRSENLKMNPKYEPSTDIKGQMKFLAELDRIEKRRYEEQERELLLKVAKSRSKAEDPEQQKLRQKAKDMQRAEQEEVRQREANETALLAIGPRKKLKTSTSSLSSFGQMSSSKNVETHTELRGDSVRRVKRVNMRDLQVLFELDRTHLNRLIKITAQ